MKHETTDRFKGCLYGQAIGDTLGMDTEFMTSEDIALIYPDGLHHYNQIYKHKDPHCERYKFGL